MRNEAGNVHDWTPSPSEFPCTSPSTFRDRQGTRNNKTVGLVQESYVTSTAVAGQPPAPDERGAVPVARQPWFGHGADRMAQYQVIRQAGPHAVCAAPDVSETRDFDTLRAPACPTPIPDRKLEHASQLAFAARQRRARVVHGWAWAKQRVEKSQKGMALRMWRRLVRANERDSGRLAPRRTHSHGRRLSAPTHGTSVPLPGSARSYRLMAISHQREATWRPGQSYLGVLTRARACSCSRVLS